jgi:hypothetical protein
MGKEYVVLQVKYEEGKERCTFRSKKPMPWFTSLMRQKNDGRIHFDGRRNVSESKKKAWYQNADKKFWQQIN